MKPKIEIDIEAEKKKQREAIIGTPDFSQREPAFPIFNDYGKTSSIESSMAAGCSSGLTKLEYACIKLKIPKSGNDELDSLIKESILNDFAGKAMEGLLAIQPVSIFADVARDAKNSAKALIKQLGEET